MSDDPMAVSEIETDAVADLPDADAAAAPETETETETVEFDVVTVVVAATVDHREEDLRLVEALLFASADPLDAAAIAERLPDGVKVEPLIAELAAHYESRGINLVRVAGGWTLRTAPDLGLRLRLEQKVARKLSRAALETLAIIGYHQPVTRAEIEEIRGVVISKGTLDTLMEIGWIAPKGHRETPGRPATWVTTQEFLKHFGLGEIRDLPGVDELRAAGLIGPRPVVSLSETAMPDLPPVEDREDSDEDDAEEPRDLTEEGDAENEAAQDEPSEDVSHEDEPGDAELAPSPAEE